MYQSCIANTRRKKRLFYHLPQELYKKEYRTQDLKLEKQILEEKHVLSSHFKVIPFITIDEQCRVFCRCILTFYKEDKHAYIGFVESRKNVQAFQVMIKDVSDFAKKHGRNTLVGPLDASFWIGYRLKLNHFEQPYMCEPYNLSYYKVLFEQAGFVICDKYQSNKFKIFTDKDVDKKCELRYYWSLEKGYKYLPVTYQSFDKQLKEIYTLLTRLYRTFPGYKEIREQEFFSMFRSLKFILDYDMVKLIYQDKKLVAFFICVPDYKNMTANLNLKNLIRIFKIKKKSKNYILLYMGVAQEHVGLGGALSHALKLELEKKKCSSIGALIHEGKTTNLYYRDAIVDSYEYALYQKKL